MTEHRIAYRVLLKPSGFLADGNALVNHPAERGAWIWHPGKSSIQTAVLRFRLRFSLQNTIAPLIHVTADQRFQFRCDGQDVSFGPDRCDREHWTVQTVRVALSPGEHEFEVLAWWIAEPKAEVSRIVLVAGEDRKTAHPPMAQVSWRGGFLLYAEEVDASLFNTGTAPWTVDDLTDAVGMERTGLRHYNDIGPCFTFDLDRWQQCENKPPKVVMLPLVSNVYGVRRPGWCLYPAELPEQRRESWTGGRIRAFRPSWDENPFPAEESHATEIADWQGLIKNGTVIVVPPHAKWTVLWDFENYHCGYPVAETEGGAGSVIEWSWAEALYEEPSSDKVTDVSSKGHRGQIAGKVFVGIEDRWRIGSGARARTPSLWWRSGRYVRLRVCTGDAPLRVSYLGIVTTGYPLERTGQWRSSDGAWDRLMPFFERAYRCSGHETWTDTPYYEQMCYVGDTLMNALSNYAWFPDDRLSRRAIRLFDWSRHSSGLVAERYPSQWRQECPTFALLWPAMVRDYAWWRDDAAFIKDMLPGIRSVLAEFEGLAHTDGLLHQLPGWPWIDWVPEWNNHAGCGPGVREGDSSLVNLFWIRALLAAAQIEEAHGDPLLMDRDRRLAKRVFDLVISRYWDGERGLLLDTRGSPAASEHAQFFALLTGLLDAEKTALCLAALCKGHGLVKATIGLSIYLLDALHRHGCEAEFYRRLEFWRGLPHLGFTSTPEGPEPGRSDAHAWGAHPAWHTLASIAGVRPDAPGFTKVRIAPMPGPLDHFDAAVVHPRGSIEIAFRRRAPGKQACRFAVRLPKGTTGTLVYAGKSYALAQETTEICV